tara:strand:- start:120 stop:263 length:144 start_codon:yes stop_codon:yes gene_type:complete
MCERHALLTEGENQAIGHEFFRYITVSFTSRHQHDYIFRKAPKRNVK